MKSPVVKSPVATTAGWSTIVVVVADAILALFDSDPLTNPDWKVLLALFILGIGKLHSADHSAVAVVAEVTNENSKILNTEQLVVKPAPKL